MEIFNITCPYVRALSGGKGCALRDEHPKNSYGAVSTAVYKAP